MSKNLDFVFWIFIALIDGVGIGWWLK